MATKKTAKKAEKMFKVTVKTNPNFCGIGAGGVQFIGVQILQRPRKAQVAAHASCGDGMKDPASVRLV